MHASLKFLFRICVVLTISVCDLSLYSILSAQVQYTANYVKQEMLSNFL